MKNVSLKSFVVYDTQHLVRASLSVIIATSISCCIHNSVLIGGDAWSENNYSESAEYTSSTLDEDDSDNSTKQAIHVPV